MNAARESEEELNAFVDGELNANDRARMLEALAHESSLQKRVADIQQTKNLLQHAYENPPASGASQKPVSFLSTGKTWVALSLALGMVSGALLYRVATTTPGLFSAAPKGVVIQVSEADPEKWKMALINASNVRKAYGNNKNVGVEIVAYGPGLNMLLKNSPLTPRLEEAHMNGVKLLACGNTMTMTRISREQLNSAVSIVPAGVVEIMERQQEGYAYVRP